MKKIFQEDIQAVKTALKGKDLRPNVKIELQDLLQSFEKQFKNSKNTDVSAVAVGEKETPKATTKTTQKDENTETYEVKGTDYTQADQDEYLAEIFNTIKLNGEEDLSTEDLKLAIENLFLDKITKKRLEQLLKEREGKKEAPEPETTTFEEFKELVVRYKVGFYYFVGYKNNKKFNSDFRYHQKLGKGYNPERTFFVEAMKKEAIFWCKDFDKANCNAKSVLQNAYKAYLGQNNLTESKKTTIDKPKSTPETKEMLKISMTKRIDVLKDLLQFADKIGKSALLDRIKVMKDLIKYTK